MNDSEDKRIIGTKRRIIEAAQMEFAENGLAGARVDRIAAESGVNKAMIYYHFQSKEKLYQEVINRLFTSVAQHVEKFLSDSDDPEQFFTRLAEYYDSLTEKYEFYVPMFLHEFASGGKRITTILDKVFFESRLTKKILAFIEKHKAQGTFRDIDGRQAVMTFIGMNKFYLLMAPALNKVWEVEDARKFKQKRPKAVVDIFLHGVLEK